MSARTGGSWSPGWAPCRPSGLGVDADLGRPGRRPLGCPHDRHLRPRPGHFEDRRLGGRDFDPSVVLDRKEIRRADRYTQLGLVAAREALDAAGLPGRLEGSLAEATGVILGHRAWAG